MNDGAQRILIVGAGSQGTIVADILQQSGRPAIGFVDDTPELLGTTILGLQVLAPVARLTEIGHDAVIVAIGDNRLRRLLVERLVAAGERLATAIHPFSSVASSAQIGRGTMISAGAIVLPRVVVGCSVILNTKSSVDHDSVVGDFSHISAGATLGGTTRVGEETLVAIGAAVASGITIGARTTIGCGAAVVCDIPDDVVAFGVPARVNSQRS